jgi:hypothetical protein
VPQWSAESVVKFNQIHPIRKPLRIPQSLAFRRPIPTSFLRDSEPHENEDRSKDAARKKHVTAIYPQLAVRPRTSGPGYDRNHDYDYALNVALIGNPNAGKSSLLQRLALDPFSEERAPKTGFVWRSTKFQTIRLEYKGLIFKIRLYDISMFKFLILFFILVLCSIVYFHLLLILRLEKP